MEIRAHLKIGTKGLFKNEKFQSKMEITVQLEIGNKGPVRK